MSCRLNHDCIRDIMLFIEESSSYSHSLIAAKQMMIALSEKYDEDCVTYHVRQLESHELLKQCKYGDGKVTWISGFTWEGHQYLDDIRDQEAWTIVKNATKDLNSISLDVIKELAKEVIMSLGKKGLKKLLE